jgi:hypothetical protein
MEVSFCYVYFTYPRCFGQDDEQFPLKSLITLCFLSGNIFIIGGCREYAGAPYFAAIAALKIFCGWFLASLNLSK